MSQATQINGSVLPPGDVVDGARMMVEAHGLNHAARMLGTGRQALATICAGLRVRRGTVALVAQSLSRAQSLDTDPPPAAA